MFMVGPGNTIAVTAGKVFMPRNIDFALEIDHTYLLGGEVDFSRVK